MKIFRVSLEKTLTTEALVMADDIDQAQLRAKLGVVRGDIEFDIDYNSLSIHAIANPEEITAMTIQDVKDYGILNEHGDLVYDSEIITELIERQKKETKEAYLKEHHMELKLE